MSVQLQEKVFNAPQKWTLSYPRRPRSTAVPKIDARRPRRPPDGLTPGPPGHSRPPHTPWGHCGRLGWPVVTCGGHPQPSRRPRTPFRYGCPRVCGSPAGDSGDPCRHQRDGIGSWGVLRGRVCLPVRPSRRHPTKINKIQKKVKKAPVLPYTRS